MGFVCAFQQAPEVKFSSSSDQTGAIEGLVCSQLESPLPDNSVNSWNKWYQIARLIEGLPF